ncbi:MAG TPA: response regulator, partial [Candidatus Acidoferrum sp.]|nr:response regulator [Candidatus Acidoferrum sp.]
MNKDMRILVVDDHGSMRRIVRRSLEELGLRNIEEAEDGAQAFGLLRTLPFDFVITDRHMPHMDGIELLRTIRADPTLAALPVLLVTAEQKREQIL